MKLYRVFTATTAAAVMLAASVLATASVIGANSAEAYPRLVRIWCKSDYQRLCPNYKVGSSRMQSCMRANKNQLSPVCKKALIDAGYAG